MNPEWVKQNKTTPEYWKMSAWAMNKLYESLKSDLHPIVANHKGNIYGAFHAFATACGEK
jgi:hypothetical protein